MFDIPHFFALVLSGVLLFAGMVLPGQLFNFKEDRKNLVVVLSASLIGLSLFLLWYAIN